MSGVTTSDDDHNAMDSTEWQPAETVGKGLRFWLVFVAVGLATFLAALDQSIISTALPTISAALSSGEQYVWIINSYLLTSTATIPIFAQAANIYGRRSLTILSVVLFALGSGLSGGATNIAMMIGGRAVQGIGGGGVVTMSEIVVCDMVSVRERGLYAGILGGVWAIATVVAPIMGGAFAENVSWRWIFYINLPISGVVIVALVLFLQLQRPPAGTLRDQLTRIDWFGSILLVLSVSAVMLALSWAGTTHPWSSWQTILPLALGFVGLTAFFGWQASPWVTEPMMPLRLFGNRTASSMFIISFVHSMLLFWVCYFLPVYFQAVKEASPARSAIMLFPIATTTAPAGVAAGAFITKTGTYRVWHFLGFALMTVSCGLFTLLDEHSSTGEWVGFQLFFGFGCGFVFTSCLPPILASLPDSDVATATGVWTFVRNFGSIWGTAIPAAVFNTRANQLASSIISNESVRASLVDGRAYEHATRAFVVSFNSDPALKQTIVKLYVDALRVVWQVSIAFCCLGFVLALLVKSIKLREELNTEFGLRENSLAAEDHGADSSSAEEVKNIEVVLVSKTFG